MSNSPKEYGIILRETREKLGLSFEDISKDTRISVKILRGLELMDKNILPSETYRLGMLKNYAQYLKIDPQQVLETLKVNELQEKPIEFELISLQSQKKARQKRILIISSIVFVVLFVVLAISLDFDKYLVGKIKANMAEVARKREIASTSKIKEIDGFIESSFILGDKIKLISGDGQKILTIDSINPAKISMAGKVFELEINQPEFIDLNDDNNPEYIVFMRSFNVARNQMLLRFDPRITQITQTSENTTTENIEQIVISDGEIINLESTSTVFPFQVTLLFNNLSYYKIVSGNGVIEEGRVKKGEVRAITSSEVLEIFVSSDSFVEIKVNQNSLPLPNEGLPYAIHVGWKQQNGAYVLQAIPIP